MRRLLRSALVIGCSGVGGCLALTDLSGLSGSAAATDAGSEMDVGDAARSDASAAEDASMDGEADAAAAAGPVNRQPNGGFEDLSSLGEGCGPGWTGYSADLTRSSMARSGSYACRACKQADASTGGFTVDGYRSLEAVSHAVGETWHAEAWVRLQAGDTSQQDGIVLIRNFAASGDTVESSRSTKLRLTTTWQKVETELAVSQPGAVLIVYVESDPGASGDCMLVDDISMYRVK